MKKSEIYDMAMLAVVDCNFNAFDKLTIIEELLDKKSLAKWEEKRKAEAQEGANA